METNKKDKIILFSRVSSDKQDYTRQVSDLTELIISDGWEEGDILTIQHKESATKNDIQNRKSIAELMGYIEEYNIKAVYVTEISRIGRRDDVTYQVLGKLNEHRIPLVVQQPQLIRTINEDGSDNREAMLLLSFFNYVAVSESKTKADRQRSGMMQAIKDGKALSANLVFGYRRQDRTKLIEIHPENAQIVREIFELYASGKESLSSIFERFKGHFRPQSAKLGGGEYVRMILHNPTYIGKHKSYKYPAIIEEELFDKVQNLMEEKAVRKPKLSTRHNYLLSQIITINGHSMSGNSRENQYRFDNRLGKMLSINMRMMDALVWNMACQAHTASISADSASEVKKYQKEIKLLQKSLIKLNKDIDDTNSQEERLQDLYIKGKLREDKFEYETDRIAEQLLYLKNEIHSTNMRILECQQVINSQDSQQDMITYNSIADITDKQLQKDIIRQEIEEVKLTRTERGKTNVQIIYKRPQPLLEKNFLIIQRSRHTDLYVLDDKGEITDNWSGSW